MAEGMKEDPKFVFYKKCREMNVPVISLLQKRIGKTLSLSGYYLSEQACAALGNAFKLSPTFVDSLILNGNGILDKGMVEIMIGL